MELVTRSNDSEVNGRRYEYSGLRSRAQYLPFSSFYSPSSLTCSPYLKYYL